MKDAQFAEANGKSYLRFSRFLVFELLLPKRLQKMRRKEMQVFLPTKNKIMFILKDAQCADQSFCIPKFFV